MARLHDLTRAPSGTIPAWPSWQARHQEISHWNKIPRESGLAHSEGHAYIIRDDSLSILSPQVVRTVGTFNLESFGLGQCICYTGEELNLYGCLMNDGVTINFRSQFLISHRASKRNDDWAVITYGWANCAGSFSDAYAGNGSYYGCVTLKNSAASIALSGAGWEVGFFADSCCSTNNSLREYEAVDSTCCLNKNLMYTLKSIQLCGNTSISLIIISWIVLSGNANLYRRLRFCRFQRRYFTAGRYASVSNSLDNVFHGWAVHFHCDYWILKLLNHQRH